VFAGYVYGARLAALFRHCALFVLPSDLEGLPLVLLEALAYGAPILASNIPPNIEVLGDTGEYFAAGDVGALQDALSRCLVEPQSAEAHSKAARGRTMDQYDWDSIASQVVDLYQRATNRGGLGQTPHRPDTIGRLRR
jgi:glycosyltransferase involved in cell wall biosynthesis